MEGSRRYCKLWSTVDTASKFEVAMSGSEIDAFLSDICQDTQNSVNSMLVNIDVGKSRAYNPTDEKQIKEAVQKTVGFATLNKIVFEQLRSWMVDTAKSRLEASPDDLSLMTALGELYKGQGKFGDAEPLLLRALEKRRETLGELHLDTLKSVNLAAILYRLKEDYERATPLHKAALKGYRHVRGDSHPDTMIAMSNLAVLYQRRRCGAVI